MISNIKRFVKYWGILFLTKEFLYLLYTFVFDLSIQNEHIRWTVGFSFIGACIWYAIWYAEHSDDENNEVKKQ